MSIFPEEHDFLVKEEFNKESDTEWFSKTFQKEIQKLIELLGPENVTLCWGFLSFIN
jgi:hypothetical protein